MTEVNRVAVIGLGYVGLPTAAALAGQGVEVVGVDVDQRVVDCVSEGTAPFDEPDLTSTLNEAVSAGMLSASTEMPQADAYIVAVPTPIKEDSHVDLAHVRSATEAIAPRLRDGEVVILESTVPRGPPGWSASGSSGFDPTSTCHTGWTARRACTWRTVPSGYFPVGS